MSGPLAEHKMHDCLVIGSVSPYYSTVVFWIKHLHDHDDNANMTILRRYNVYYNHILFSLSSNLTSAYSDQTHATWLKMYR